MGRTLLMALLTMASTAPLLQAQMNPVVKMTVTLPDGRTTQVSAPESGLAEVTLPDQTKVGVRPTILDDKPWTKVEVTLFRMPTATQGVQDMGSVEVRKGGPAVAFKLSPTHHRQLDSIATGRGVSSRGGRASASRARDPSSPPA